jgi:hypothetical protein
MSLDPGKAARSDDPLRAKTINKTVEAKLFAALTP